MTARRHMVGSAASLLALIFAVAACGTRVDHDQVVAAATIGAGSTDVAGDTSHADGVGSAGGSDRTNDALTGTPGDGDGSRSGEDAAEETGSGAPSSEGHDAQARAGATPPEGGGSKGPIVVGMIGNFSGVVGASFAPARDSLQAWAQSVNARGGIDGHHVKLLVADDGNDGARDVAIAKEFVEQRGAIALINLFPAAGGETAVARYADSKNIPVIGGATFNEVFFKSPMMFPQTTGFQTWYAGQARAAKDAGGSKVAMVYCTEGAVCEQNASTFERYARQAGLEVVYKASVSLAQPDFTAECINARSAGADLFYPVVDGNAINRLAQSCDRQGYAPTYFVSAPVDPPVRQLEGAIALIPSFPWFLSSGSPAVEEFAAAMERYASGKSRNSFTGFGWASGKLLEKAAANVSNRPSTQELLDGLWSLEAETLGGLAPPLTFRRGSPAPEPDCGYFVVVEDGRWTAPDGLELAGCSR